MITMNFTGFFSFVVVWLVGRWNDVCPSGYYYGTELW